MRHMTTIYDPAETGVSVAHIKNPNLGRSELTIISPYVQNNLKKIYLGFNGDFEFMDTNQEYKGLVKSISTKNNFSFILQRKRKGPFIKNSDVEYFFLNIDNFRNKRHFEKSGYSNGDAFINAHLLSSPDLGSENIGILQEGGRFRVYKPGSGTLENVDFPGHSKFFLRYNDVPCMGTNLLKEDFTQLPRSKHLCSELYGKLIQAVSKLNSEIPTFLSLDGKIAGVDPALKSVLASEFKGCEGLLEKWV
ncbi:hypothetical protein KY334_01090 [Candidatus Woesearchaeota archaeon]|nr:hypothetical protein [Candidatus Woesearchaeota archaeon]